MSSNGNLKRELPTSDDEDFGPSTSKKVCLGSPPSDEEDSGPYSGKKICIGAPPSDDEGADTFANEKAKQQKDCCAICLEIPIKQVATPGFCEHTFCVKCLIKWSRIHSTCPIDREKFNIVLVWNKKNGNITKILSNILNCINGRPGNRACGICMSRRLQNTMLPCSGCRNTFHSRCVFFPLSKVLLATWTCSECGMLNRLRS